MAKKIAKINFKKKNKNEIIMAKIKMVKIIMENINNG
jgi:hypothetical protein